MATIGRSIDPEAISRYLLRGDTLAAPQAPNIGAAPKQPLPTTEEEFGQRLDQYYEQVEKPAKDAALLQQQEIAANTPPTKPGLFERVMERVGAGAIETAPLQQAGEVGAAEAALSTVTGLVGGAAGLGVVGAGAVMAPVLGLAKTPEKRATYWKDLIEASKEVGSRMTFEPRTEVGKALMAAPNAVMETIGKISEMASEAPLARILLTPDQRQLLKYAHELATITVLTEGGIKGIGGIKSKLAKYKSEFSKAEGTTPTDASALIAAAEDLSSAVEKNPAITENLVQARQRLVDTLRSTTEQLPQRLSSALSSRPEQTPGLSIALDRIAKAEAALTDPNTTTSLARRAREFKVANAAVAKLRAETPSPSSIIESSNVTPTKITTPVVDTTPAIAKPARVRAPRKKIVTEEPPIVESTVATSESVPTTVQETLPPTTPTYSGVSLKALQKALTAQEPVSATSIPSGPLQLRYANKKPDAILVDTSGLYSSSSIETIRRSVERGQTAPDIAQAMEANLQRQAILGDVPIEQAHKFTGDRVLSEATRFAYENNLELYHARRTKIGIEYEQVPPEAIKTAIDLQRLNPLEPIALSKENAATYVAEKTRPVGSTVLEEIKVALESLTDISNTLPAEVVPHFQELLAAQRKGLNLSSPRKFADIFQDLVDIILPYDPTELGSLAVFGLSDVRKAAALRLWGDAQKLGRSFSKFLDGTNLTAAEKTLFMRYIDSAQKPDLPVGITAPELRFDPRQSGNTNPIMHQRTIRRDGVDVPQTPLHYSDLEGVYRAKDLPERGIQGLTAIGPFQPGAANVSRGANIKPKTFLEPYYALRRADWLEPLYAYRASERAGAREAAVLQKDLDAMTKVHNRASLERIGEDGYSNSLQGINILIKNDRDIPTLNANEKVTAAALRNLFDETWLRINEVREATGKPSLNYVEDYIPFQRAMSLAEKLGEPINLLSSSPEMIFGRVDRMAELQFPRAIARTGATYRAEFNAFRLTQDFMRQALPQIHMEPFLAKLGELIGEALPDPKTGEATWLLKEQKPHLYEYLQDWHNRIATGIEPSFSPIAEKVINTLMRGISGAVLFGPRSALVQLNTLKLASHAIGPMRLVQGAYDAVADGARYFFSPEGTKIGELFRESQVLDTRGMIDAYDGVANALIGGSAKDFMAALRSGELRRIERSFDNTVVYKFMSIVDSMAAIVTGLGAKRLIDHASTVNMLDKVAKRNFVDDIIVQANGGTMPGDLASAFRSTGSRALLQFQRFVVHDWNYWIEDVFGAGGRKDIARLLNRDPDKYLPAVIKSILAMGAATTISNVLYEDVIGMQSPNSTPVRTMLKSIDQNDSVMKTAGKVALEFIEPIPVLSSTRYGKGIGGPLLQTAYEAQQSIAGAPLAYPLSKPDDTISEATARLYGSPVAKLLGLRGAGLVGKAVRGDDRGQGVWPSLLGMYQPTQSGSGRRELRRPESTFRRVR